MRIHLVKGLAAWLFRMNVREEIHSYDDITRTIHCNQYIMQDMWVSTCQNVQMSTIWNFIYLRGISLKFLSMDRKYYLHLFES
jgi:hypothetical protein